MAREGVNGMRSQGCIWTWTKRKGPDRTGYMEKMAKIVMLIQGQNRRMCTLTPDTQEQHVNTPSRIVIVSGVRVRAPIGVITKYMNIKKRLLTIEI